MANYTLNFAPIDLQGNTEILIGRQSYSVDKLRELRSEFYNTHIFQRFGIEDAIVDIPIVADTQPIGNVHERVDLNKMRGVWSALLSAALLRAFRGQRDIRSAWPVSVLGTVSRGLIHHPKIPTWLQKRTALEFDTRSIYLPGGRRLLGIVCDTRVRNIIDGTCDELIASGIDDEENMPSIGHKKPRADLGIPSLRTIVEVKFLRDRGQRGFAKIIDEIAADASLYLSRTSDYDNIIAFVWDDCAQTEQHHELKSGIEQIKGISAAIVLPRPSSMQR
jgi:hypothetical protein